MTLTFTCELFKYIMCASPTTVLQQALLVVGTLRNINRKLLELFSKLQSIFMMNINEKHKCELLLFNVTDLSVNITL